MADHRAPRRRRKLYPDTAPPALAYTSLAAGLTGLAGAWIPGPNYITGVIAAMGLVLGVVGIWISRQILSGVAVVVCGTAILITLAVTHAAGELSLRDKESRADVQMHYNLGLPLSAAGGVAVSHGC